MSAQALDLRVGRRAVSAAVGVLLDPVGAGRVIDVRWTALISFAAGIAATWSCMHGKAWYLQGPVSDALGGLDVSWLAGGTVSGGLYFILSRMGGRVRRLPRIIRPTRGLVHDAAEEAARVPAAAWSAARLARISPEWGIGRGCVMTPAYPVSPNVVEGVPAADRPHASPGPWL